MKNFIFLIFFTFFQLFLGQKTVFEQLDSKVNQLLASEPMYSGNLSFYVADDLGNKIYEYQPTKGLSTASTMKVFTAAAALETLGKDFQYKTSLAYDGNLYLTSNGDPTLGNDRFEGYKAENFLMKVTDALKMKNITQISGDLILDDTFFDFQKIPGGWPWNDLGNYYGAGVWGINWRENVFEINTFGKDMKRISYLNDVNWVNELRTEGNSDKSLIYIAPYSSMAHINGTLPAKSMKVSGAMPNPPKQLAIELIDALKKQNIDFKGNIIINSEQVIKGKKTMAFPEDKVILEYKSPTLDKIVYWFLKKSVNLFGETFVKTMAKQKTGTASFEEGIKYLKSFWKEKGIDERMINFVDGSGLSPQNYASAKAEVQALLWAKKQAWFTAYYDGFPVMANGMKMKSGSIKDCRAFAGFHTSENGKNYVFSIIMNNYQATDLSNALYNVLNVLK